LKKAQWFECTKPDQKYIYKPLAKKDEYKPWFDKYYSDKETGIVGLLAIFGKERTEKAEMAATLYEAYRDLKERQIVPTEDLVVNEVLNNWHDSKKRIEESRWRVFFNWMLNRNWIG
jgi:type I restriction enzyme S subunit